MKIKLLISSIALLSVIAAPAVAWDSSSETRIFDDSSNGYKSSFGNTYQYDLSNPSDRTRYSTDTSAQMRDSMDINPSRSLERGMGQYGGGVYDD